MTITCTINRVLALALIIGMSTSSVWAEGNFTASNISLVSEVKRSSNPAFLGMGWGEDKVVEDTIPKTPKEIRLAFVKDNLYMMVLTNAASHSFFGGATLGLVTAQPFGVLLGGVVGALQGRSDRYKAAEIKLHEMEQEILASEDFDITEEEERLAYFAGKDIHAYLPKISPLFAKKEVPVINEPPVVASDDPVIVVSRAPIIDPIIDIDHCRSDRSGDNASLAYRLSLQANLCRYSMR